MNIRQEIEDVIGQPVTDIDPLSGGCIGKVFRVRLAGGSEVVAKIDESVNPRLDIEGFMLRYLAEHSDLPVPQVWYDSPQMLLISFIHGNSHFSKRAENHAAELLASLHNIEADSFGLEKDTLIGGLPQPNTRMNSWVAFFRRNRLLYMGKQGFSAGRLPASVLRRLEQFCNNLENWLEEPDRPSLIHGDVWTTNILADGDKITGFVDPAIYYADPEIELAFTTLFGTFGDPFFERYQEIRPLKPGFFEERRDIYNLYPLLVHVRLFGGSYISNVDTILRRFGF